MPSQEGLLLSSPSHIETKKRGAAVSFFSFFVGLPTCAWEHNLTNPGLVICAASSLMGVASMLLAPSTLGAEPAPFNGVPTAGTACDWTKTPATLTPTSKTGGLAPPPTPAPTSSSTSSAAAAAPTTTSPTASIVPTHNHAMRAFRS